MINVTNKINKIPDVALSALGMTKEGLLHKQKQENAALSMCAGLLGNCYIMATIVDWILIRNGKDVLNELKAQPWFKQKIKFNVNKAFEELELSIKDSHDSSLSDTDYMEDIADGMYDEMKPELAKLKNGILIELNKYKINKADVVADFIMVDILLNWIPCYYDFILEQMKGIYSAYYNSWFFQARFTGPSKKWSMAINEFGNRYIDKDIDLSNSSMIKGGLKLIDDKMKDAEISNKLRQSAEESWGIQDEGNKVYQDSLKILGIDTHKELPKPKKPKEQKRFVPIDEQVAVENSIDKLAEKFKVIKK